ncbi:MAG: type III secretion inner membrane ring lipoprotein SctJ [Parachlamydiales bacterium]|nr:type III secretion inner membrane ring lipoprotein SctJ [Parachlamydiales bacterium]
MYKWVVTFFLFVLSFFLSSCQESHYIVNNIEEREANEIVVFLASKGISAQKIQAASTQTAGVGPQQILWNITVDADRAVEAMAILNRYGLPRKKGTTLLQLFAKEGLMSSDKEEKIRYQSGLEEELKNIIRKIDGVIDADVRISFPISDTGTLGETTTQKMKAAVYIKHQGVFDDPNNHLESKVKRLVSGSIDNLDFDDVSVISDISLFSQLSLTPETEKISPLDMEKEYVSLWSMIMTKKSVNRFRFIFFLLIFIILVLGGSIGWLAYKFFPMIHKGKNEQQPSEENSSKTSSE